MEQQKVIKNPSRESIIKILEDANPEVSQRFIFDLIKSNKNVEKWFDRLPLGTRPSVGEVLNAFFNAFSNESEAFAAISYIRSKLGSNFPISEATSGDGDDDSIFTSGDGDNYSTPSSPYWSPSSSESSSRGAFPYDTASSSSEFPWSSLSMSQDDPDSPFLRTRRDGNGELSTIYPSSGSSRLSSLTGKF